MINLISLLCVTYNTLLFSLLPGRSHFSCALLPIFSFFLLTSQDLDEAGWYYSQFGRLIFFYAIFLHLVRVLFTALGTCLFSPTSFSVVFIFLTFQAPKGCWDILFNLQETIPDFHFLENMGLIKNQDVGVDLDSLSELFNGDSSDVCHAQIFSGQLSSPLL